MLSLTVFEVLEEIIWYEVALPSPFHAPWISTFVKIKGVSFLKNQALYSVFIVPKEVEQGISMRWDGGRR